VRWNRSKPPTIVTVGVLLQPRRQCRCDCGGPALGEEGDEFLVLRDERVDLRRLSIQIVRNRLLRFERREGNLDLSER
jgi:hypothetical protein